MKLRHLKNHYDGTKRRVSFEEFDEVKDSQINVETVVERELSNVPKANEHNTIDVNLSTHFLKNSKLYYPAATGLNGDTPRGEFVVAEKWENPYWKFQKRTGERFVYLPGERNPIGTKLIILYDPETKQKIPAGIHRWDFLNEGEFRQGPYSRGCIRLQEKDMNAVFNYVNLGDTVRITK
ncbi:L,D-transpeptidase [Candidatus Woesearchaeota archaeon]|nr:L,D-transpeptidase [Candidatus Woesearchaeota archaeon]